MKYEYPAKTGPLLLEHAKEGVRRATCARAGVALYGRRTTGERPVGVKGGGSGHLPAIKGAAHCRWQTQFVIDLLAKLLTITADLFRILVPGYAHSLRLH